MLKKLTKVLVALAIVTSVFSPFATSVAAFSDWSDDEVDAFWIEMGARDDVAFLTITQLALIDAFLDAEDELDSALVAVLEAIFDRAAALADDYDDLMQAILDTGLDFATAMPLLEAITVGLEALHADLAAVIAAEGIGVSGGGDDEISGGGDDEISGGGDDELVSGGAWTVANLVAWDALLAENLDAFNALMVQYGRALAALMDPSTSPALRDHLLYLIDNIGPLLVQYAEISDAILAGATFEEARDLLLAVTAGYEALTQDFINALDYGIFTSGGVEISGSTGGGGATLPQTGSVATLSTAVSGLGIAGLGTVAAYAKAKKSA